MSGATGGQAQEQNGAHLFAADVRVAAAHVRSAVQNELVQSERWTSIRTAGPQVGFAAVCGTVWTLAWDGVCGVAR